MNKRERSICYNLDTAVVDLWKREIGQISGRTFAGRLGASEDLVLRLDLHRNLVNQRGHIMTAAFSPDGDILVSACSPESRVTLWDWQSGRTKLSFYTGHIPDIVQAKIMPFSDGRSIVTCALDGQVRHAMIRECGQVGTKLLGAKGRVHKLAVQHGSPHLFYTCGRDGVVQHFDLRTRSATKLFTCQALQRDGYLPFLYINAIEVDPRNCNHFAVAGADEYARLYDIRKNKKDGSSNFGLPAAYFCPPHLIGDLVQITGLAFSTQSELLATYRLDFIYLFRKDMGLGHIPDLTSPNSIDADEVQFDHIAAESSSDGKSYTEDYPQVYKGHGNEIGMLKGVNFFGPSCEYVVSGSDCGRIFIWRKRNGELLRVINDEIRWLVDVEPHPHKTVLASGGKLSNIKVWIPKAVERATLIHQSGGDSNDYSEDELSDGY